MTLIQDVCDFRSRLEESGLSLAPVSVETLQVNITRLCNQACRHCHVGASPSRQEHIHPAVAEKCIDILAEHEQIEVLDITGGAPELSPSFEFLVREAKRLARRVMVRHNLTVTLDGNPQSGEDKSFLPGFFAENGVEVIASLPHYERDRVDGQRGAGVFARSVRAMRFLNDAGYGKEGTGLLLTLVHNPEGSALPASQEKLEAEFRTELGSRYGISFNTLYTMTNVPVNRFRECLEKSGAYADYLRLLADSFNPEAAGKVMCRSMISAGPDGRIYDCDFNQMLGLQVALAEPVTVFNFDYDLLLQREIRFGPHCFACTAGGGSG